MKNKIKIRKYADKDKKAVLEVFESNYPKFFGDKDREWLKWFLKGLDGPTFVVKVRRKIVGFGGYEVSSFYNKAYLTFGMVHADCHKFGLGKLLLLHRIRHLARRAKLKTDYVFVDTTPMISGFFEHFGFELLSVWKNGYRSGFDMHELRLELTAEIVEKLEESYVEAIAEAQEKIASNCFDAAKNAS